jgi:hypothetical protein
VLPMRLGRWDKIRLKFGMVDPLFCSDYALVFCLPSNCLHSIHSAGPHASTIINNRRIADDLHITIRHDAEQNAMHLYVGICWWNKTLTCYRKATWPPKIEQNDSQQGETSDYDALQLRIGSNLYCILEDDTEE